MISSEEKRNLLMQLCTDYISCKKCPLGERQRKVFGAGNVNADLMFIDIAPGEEEENETTPMVGPGGSIFNALLEKVGLNRKDIYITNLVWCRAVESDNPNKNRTPLGLEIEACRDRLNKEIYIVDPKVIVLLGAPPLSALVRQDKTSLTNARGRVHLITMRGKDNALVYPALSTWNMAYLLRNPCTQKKDPLHDCLCDFTKAINLAKIYKEKIGELV